MAQDAESTPPAEESAEAEAVSHDIPMARQLQEAIAADWAPAAPMPHPARPDGAPWTARRRAALSAALPGRLIAVPAGPLVTRANDTEYAFRAASSFTWLTGETVEDAVLVLTPTTDGHDAVLYLREYAKPGEVRYFTSRMHGAIWVGNVPTPPETEAVLGVTCRPLSDLADDLGRWRDERADVLPGVDRSVEELLPNRSDGTELARILDELRLVKDDWEVDRLRHACAATARGFADVARELPMLLERGGRRGERWLEGTFWRRARLEGNEVGYTSIVAAQSHGTTLHWWRNNGDIRSGDLLLADMGIETDELYTADVTRTLPINGQYSPDQLKVYQAVYEAQSAGIAEAKSGADFLAAHRAATYVLADYLHSWGILPVPAEVACDSDPERPGAGLHRRYTLHGVSHMLGIDVHDCAQARDETYRNGTLAPGYVLTVEPGLYFQANDLSVPAELRGIGVRIEDDILVTDGDPVNLSADLPRDAEGVQAWMREVQQTPAVP
jgi:Xaa-Pro aminopeptidase